jgi:hypothetical protein
MAVLVTALGMVVFLLGLLVVGLLRSHAEIVNALGELGVNLDPASEGATGAAGSQRVGTPRRPDGIVERTEGIPKGFDITGVSPRGESVSVAVVGIERMTLVAFLSGTCLSCRDFWDAFAEPRLEVPGGARLVAVTKGPEAESPATVAALAPRNVQTVMSSEAWADYAVPVAPYFLLVDGATGDVVGEGASTTWRQVQHLMGQALADGGLAVEHDRRGRAPEAPAREARLGGAAREARVDGALRAAGIEPDHPSLYPAPSED